MTVLLEICIDSIESALAAKEGGADRLEVCSSLAGGGTTPSLGLVKQCVADIQLPVMMMIRPHEGGFVYQENDLEAMLTDIESAQSIGVRGVVFGALTAERQIDLEQCQRLLTAATSLQTTFHRAFDLVVDPIQSLNQLIELRFDRLLTSGQTASAQAGIPLIRQLCDHAQERITLLAGAGVNSQNAQQIVTATGVCELHASASVLGSGQSQGNVQFGTDRRVTSVELVRAIRQSLRDSA
ncbi:MAG: copper homeostasis protein CutC [Planctomycetes bacterium]|nr:copper homeostasis protein CutC [Planctomycetota bacterium]